MLDVRYDAGGTQAVERGAGFVELPPDAGGGGGGGGDGGKDGFLFETQDGLEEVVVEPHVVVKLVEQMGLPDGVQALIAEVGADQGAVLLLDEAVVVALEGSAARELNALVTVLPEAAQMIVEELAAVVGVNFQDGDG